jgi:hypothetical protein
VMKFIRIRLMKTGLGVDHANYGGKKTALYNSSVICALLKEVFCNILQFIRCNCTFSM